MKAENGSRPGPRQRLEAARASAVRWIFGTLAWVFVVLAVLGIVIPGLPTTPFVLLAAWAASRGSTRVHDWLERHPRLGPALAHWREERAVSTRAKALAVGFLGASWLLMLWRGIPERVLAVLAVLFLGVAWFVVTRPRPGTPADVTARR